MNNSTEFPCVSFKFLSDPEREVGQETAQTFLDAHGASVRKLSFLQDLYLEDVRHLLLNQAPNLQQLYLGPIETFSKNSPETKKLFDETASKANPVLKNLKIFKCHLSIDVPEIFIRQILECSPNLVEVKLPEHCLLLLVQAINRVHLIKKLKVDMYSYSAESYNLFANHYYLQENKNLAIRETVCYSGEYDDIEKEDGGVGMFDAMKNILRACSATCQKLVWTADVRNFEIPRMPQVKHLAIQYFKGEEESDLPVNNLPNGVKLGNTFPNLQSLEVRTRVEMKNLPIANIFCDENPLPASNVKEVTLRLRRPGENLLQSFKNMFPKAYFQRKGRAVNENDGYDSEEYFAFGDDSDDGDDD